MEVDPVCAKKVIFFDGNCMLCNSFIAFMVKKKIGSLFFCDINSDIASQLLATYSFTDLPKNTIYFLSYKKLYWKSTAVLKILSLLGPVSKFCSHLLLIIPAFIRDAVYSLVAKNRYRFFKQTSCYSATEVEKEMFL